MFSTKSDPTASTLELHAGLRRSTSILAIGLTGLVLLSVWAVEPRPLPDQPFPDAHETADAVRNIVQGRGYVTDIYQDTNRPRSPPGYSLALVPFVALSKTYPANVQQGAKSYAALYVLAAVFAAWSIGGPIAACLMAIFVGLSPFARTEASLIMADALSASLTVLVAALVHHPSNRKIWVAGAIAGGLVVVRFQMGLVLIALCCVIPNTLRVRAALAAGPFLVALAVYLWVAFGSPFHTGYQNVLGENLSAFAWSNAAHPLTGDGPWVVADVLDGRLLQWVCPCPVGGPQAALVNVWFYPAVLLGFFWIYAVPFATALGFVQLWRRRHEVPAQFSALLIALNLTLFIFYFYQGTRFMAGPATLLGIFAASYLAELIGTLLSRRARLATRDSAWS